MQRTVMTMNAVLALGLGLLTSPSTAQAGRNLVVQFLGTAQGQMRSIDINGDGIDDVVNGICFDVDIVNPRTGRVIGQGIDCLTDITPNGEGLTLTDTAIFRLRGGALVSQGPVTLQPALDPETLASGVTHITGAVPARDNVIFGSRDFRHALGRVQLSGAVDLRGFANDPPEIDFDCLFVIELD